MLNYSSRLLLWVCMCGLSQPMSFSCMWSIVVLCITLSRHNLSFFGTLEVWAFYRPMGNAGCIICPWLIPLQPLRAVSSSWWLQAFFLPDGSLLLVWLTISSPHTLCLDPSSLGSDFLSLLVPRVKVFISLRWSVSVLLLSQRRRNFS